MQFESLSFGVCVGTFGAMLLFTYKCIIGSTVHALGTNAMYGSCLGLDSRYVLEMDSGLMSSVRSQDWDVCVVGWVPQSLLRFVCGSNFASVAVAALTPIQSVAAVSRIGTVGLTVFELDTRLASPPLACLHNSVAAWIFYWRLHAVGHGHPLGPLQLHGWQDDGLSFSMRYCGSECSWVL
jgi:hypothetical protein